MWSWRRISSGRYGEVFRRGDRDQWVVLSNVEAAEGVTFTPSQLRAAGVSVAPVDSEGMADAA
jgi:hypothetical protein